MKRAITSLLALLFAATVLLATPALAADAEPAAGNDLHQAAMNQLAKAAFEQSLRIIIESKKPIYPFALLQFKGGTVQTVTYQPQRNKDGTLAPQPDEAEWAEVLFRQLQKMTIDEPELEVVLLAKMHTVKAKDGSDVLGVWVEVDHRETRPWVIFMPLLEQENGSLKQGDLVYYATDQPIFLN